MLGSITPKYEFFMSSRIVTRGYRNRGILRLSNMVFEFLSIMSRIKLRILPRIV